MSDDLEERLYDRRVCSPAQNSCRNDHVLNQAIARIKELEANINLKADFIDATINQLAASDQRIEELEAKLKELLVVSKRAVRLSLDHADFKLYAMEPMHQAIAAAELKGQPNA